MYSATCAVVVATSDVRAPAIKVSSRPRSTASATLSVERMMPVPWQCGHCVVEPSSTPVRIRWRDISMRPKCEIWPS